MLITPKGVESPASGRIGVIGALVFFSICGRSDRWTNFALPGSALRHREVADFPEAADYVDARTCPQITADVILGQSPGSYTVSIRGRLG